MPKKIIVSEEERAYQKFFQKGVNVAGLILSTLQESGECFLRQLPDCYPGFKFWKTLLGVKNKRYKMPVVKKNTFHVNIRRLKQQGLIAQNIKEKTYTLTVKGKKIMLEIENRLLLEKQPWDGKLRLVVFDIPEKQKEWREWLRLQLLILRFKPLQKSVYVGQKSLPESFYQALVKNGLAPCLFILTVGEIDQKEKILKMLKEK